MVSSGLQEEMIRTEEGMVESHGCVSVSFNVLWSLLSAVLGLFACVQF